MTTLIVGKKTKVHADVQFVGTGSGNVIIGDYCRIGSGVKVVVGDNDVLIGDWTTLHDNTLVLGGAGVTIGAHCWFGQNCILDGTGRLDIGNGVRVGMYSQIWSHVAAGEQIEGCTLIGERPVRIEDNVWLVGSCIVASGVTLGRRLVALIASNITKSFPANVVIAGAPAQIKDSLNFYRNIDVAEKFQLLVGWLEDYANSNGLNLQVKPDCSSVTVQLDDEYIEFFAEISGFDTALATDSQHTICCVQNKKYRKTFSQIEENILGFLAGNKARFYS